LRPREKSLHERLKQATAELHESAESAFDLQRLLSDRNSYCRALGKLRNIHLGVEHALQKIDWLNMPIDLAARMKKSTWLNSDLEALVYTASPLRVEEPALAVSSIGAGLGSLYVIEGATLGGRVIYNRVNKGLLIDLNNGGRFFYGYGQATMDMWSRFLLVINGFEAHSNVGDEVVASAKQTFELFLRELSA
jgi:heme oxygenase (biliverdin-IX-beta and delta-forming)